MRKTHIALIVLFIIIVVIVVTSGSIIKDSGYFKISYDSVADKNKYEKYVNDAASYWSDILNKSHDINVDINIYSSSSTTTIASASIRSTNSSGLATAGTININTHVFNGISSSTRYNAIRHEFGHILGIGYWTSTLGTGDASRISPSAYPTALSEFNSLTGSSFTVGVPIESSGGAGTVGAHWENNYRANFAGTGDSSKGLKNELMAGYIGSSAFLSGVTLGYLKDIGWDIDMGKKDPDSKFIFELSSKTGLELNNSSSCGVGCATCGRI